MNRGGDGIEDLPDALTDPFVVDRQLCCRRSQKQCKSRGRGGVQLILGGAAGPTTSDIVLNAVMKEIVRRTSLDAMYVPPRRALGLASVKRLPPDLSAPGHLFVAGFDGPRAHGHFYGLHWDAHARRLIVADQSPQGKVRDVTLAVIRLVRPRAVEYVRLPKDAPGTCADSVVEFFAQIAFCSIAQRLFPLHEKSLASIARLLENGAVTGGWRCRSCPGSVSVRCRCPRVRDEQPELALDLQRSLSDGLIPREAKCGLCKSLSCECFETLEKQRDRLLALQELQKASGRAIDQSGGFVKGKVPSGDRGTEGCVLRDGEHVRLNPVALLATLQTIASTLEMLAGLVRPLPSPTPQPEVPLDPWSLVNNDDVWGGGDDDTTPDGPSRSQSKLNDLIAKQQFCDAPALSFDEQKARLFEDGPPRPGEWVRVIRRAGIGDEDLITVDTLQRREEIGQIVSVSSTRGICTVRWEMTPYGFVREYDDDAGYRFHRSSLPAVQTGSHAILYIEKLGISKPPERDANDEDNDHASSASDDDTSGSDCGSDSSRSEGDVDGDEHFSPYAAIDLGEELQASLWEVYDLNGVSGRTHSNEAITGTEFLQAKKLSFDSAKARTPSLVWASCAEDTRKRHIAELKRFEEYLRAHPTVQHLSLDVLLAHYFQVQLKTRKKDGTDLAWGSMSTLMGTMVGALSAFPIYADTKLAIRPSRWPFFKNMLDAAERMKAKHPPRKIEPATYDDVKVARAHLSDAMQVALIVMWFTGSRFSTDVAHLQKKSFRFGDNGDVTVHYLQHKTGKTAGRYTIATKINDPDAHAKVKAFVDALPNPSSYLFPLPADRRAGQKERSRLGAQLLEALRKSRRELEIKSMRQGTLQMLAKLGLTDAQILTFTHHTSAQTLKSYLEGEQVLHETQRQAQQMAAGLAGGDECLLDVAAEVIEEPCHAMFEPLTPSSVPLDYWAAVDKNGRITYSALPPDPKKPDRSGYRLHAKPETAEGISWQHVLELSTTTEETKEFLRAQLVWVSNATGAYGAVPWDGKIRHASLTADQIKQLVAINNIAAVGKDEEHKVAGTIHIFKVPEDSKMRWRVIKHTEAFNDFYGKDTVARTGNTTRRRAREAILGSECCIDMDLAGTSTPRVANYRSARTHTAVELTL